MSKEYIRVKELAQMWGVTPRRINQLCAENYFPGAYKDGKFWLIPAYAEKPAVLRVKQTQDVSSRVQTTELLPCPVGITSYKEVSKECYYVDKTLLIREIIDEHSKVYLFTRPHRFGKTLTMDMIRTYFEKTNTDTSKYFTDKLIWFTGDGYKDYQGKYPVIFLSLKDARQPDWNNMYKSLCFTLKDEFLRHIEILSGDALNDYDRKYFVSVMDGSADLTDYQFALGKLSSMLAAHYGQKVIIIIDEYDTPLLQGHLNGYYDEVAGFMRNLLSAVLKDNDNLEFGILTGILKIERESLFSGLNNPVINTILDDKYSKYFGFTGEDVSGMAAYYEMEDRLPEIKKWYSGYLFGSTEIYNPLSVISYINNNCKPKAFWSQTDGNEIIGQLIQNSGAELCESLSLLLQGKEIHSIIYTDIIYPEVTGNPDTIFSFLLIAGYLKITEVISELNDNLICSLEIPNREIKSVFQKEILGNYPTLFTGALLRNFEVALRTGNTDLFTKTLREYLVQSAGSFDTVRENFYHVTVLGMLAIMSDCYYISSSRESGNRCFDIQLEPKDKAKAGYIIEFKAEKGLPNKKLAGLAKEIIKQMHDKKYSADMENHGIKEIVFFGIAFNGKRAAAEFEQLLI